MPSFINEKGQTENEKGNILCRKIGTRKDGMPWEKTQHLSKLVVNNPEWMRTNSWEVVMKPEVPPVKNGKSNFSSGSYDQERNLAEATNSNAEQENINSSFLAKMREGEEIEKKENSDLEFNEPVFAKRGNETTEIPAPKKRGPKPGSKRKRKVTTKQKINA